MKKSNKKGFTIVELVIVIAVIAILAAVLIPTFTNVIEKANQSKALQGARNLYTALMAENDANLSNLGTINASASGNANEKLVDEYKATSATYNASNKTLAIVIGDYTVTFNLTGSSDPAIAKTNA